MKNIAYFLIPKSNVAFLYEDFTIRQALEKMKFHGYSAIPVITREGKYICTVSEGDFLRYVLSEEYEKNKGYSPLTDILDNKKYPPVKITSTVDTLLERACNQNFIPVIDDADIFVGIVTRKAIMMTLTDKKEAVEK